VIIHLQELIVIRIFLILLTSYRTFSKNFALNSLTFFKFSKSLKAVLLKISFNP